MFMKKNCLLWICVSLGADPISEKVFTEIYEGGDWDENGFVWSGSQIEITREYVTFLQDFMRKNQIRTVLDIGCGDWAFSRYIDWSGVQYIGIDIVKRVVERNQRLFAGPSIVFIHGDALDLDLPEADLMVCKDMLQYLPNGEIIRLFKQLRKFKHCLFTNNVAPTTLSSRNPDAACGQYRPIDLTKPPFNLQGRKVLTFYVDYFPKQVLYTNDFKNQ